MTPEAQEQRRAYNSRYRKKNRGKINQQHREWYARNREKSKEYQDGYWERRAKKAVREPDMVNGTV